MYLIFGGKSYYPDGGVGDLLCIKQYENEAMDIAKELVKRTIIRKPPGYFDEQEFDIDWIQVFCTDKQSIIYQYWSGDEHGLVKLDLKFNFV